MGKIEDERTALRELVDRACRVGPVSAVTHAPGSSGSSDPSGGGVRKSVVGAPEQARKSYAVVVRASGDTLDADGIKKLVMADVKKAAPELKVSAVRRVKNGVAIEVADSKGLETLKACKKYGEVGLKVDEPRKIGPLPFMTALKNSRRTNS